MHNKNIKFYISQEKVLKQYVTLKKEKKVNPIFSRMPKENLTDIETYLNKNTSAVDDPERNRTKTMFTTHKTVKEVKLEDFRILKVIGRGSFGKVCLVEYTPTKEIYAMKSLKKDILIEQEQIENTLLEKEILQTIDHPLLCGLVFCFQTQERIYLDRKSVV